MYTKTKTDPRPLKHNKNKHISDQHFLFIDVMSPIRGVWGSTRLPKEKVDFFIQTHFLFHQFVCIVTHIDWVLVLMKFL